MVKRSDFITVRLAAEVLLLDDGRWRAYVLDNNQHLGYGRTKAEALENLSRVIEGRLSDSGRLKVAPCPAEAAFDCD